MKIFSRDRPPGAATALLAQGERVVSWADTADGTVVLATPLGLWWPFADGARRIGWQRVSKAAWQDDLLSVTEAEDDEGVLIDLPPVSVRLTVPRDLPFAVRQRVQGNIVRSDLVRVGAGAVRFVQRRIPGADGTQWTARPEPGARLSAADLAAVRVRLELLRDAPASGAL